MHGHMNLMLQKISVLSVSAVADWVQTLHTAEREFRNPQRTPTREERYFRKFYTHYKVLSERRDSSGSSPISF